MIATIYIYDGRVQFTHHSSLITHHAICNGREGTNFPGTKRRVHRSYFRMTTTYTPRSFLSVALAAAFSVSFMAAVSLHAATTNIIVGFNGGFTFSPTNTTIHQHDTVIWVWGGANHSTTSLPGMGDTTNWDSGITNAPHTFTNTYDLPGVNAYQCTVHGSIFNMKGSVIVTAVANTPPTVSITSPPTNGVLSTPANVVIHASAADSDGTVSSVQLFVDNNQIGNITTPPYTATTNNVGAGTHTLMAIATDNGGATGTNTFNVTVVAPVAVALSQALLVSGTNFDFSYSANTGLFYVIDRSTNLENPWVPLQTNQATSDPMTFVDSNTVASPVFYRVGRMPNPN